VDGDQLDLSRVALRIERIRREPNGASIEIRGKDVDPIALRAHRLHSFTSSGSPIRPDVLVDRGFDRVLEGFGDRLECEKRELDQDLDILVGRWTNTRGHAEPPAASSSAGQA